MSDSKSPALSRAEEILVVAQDLIQTRGYNGFSYRDLAAAIGIKSASIHYHYPTKGDLGQAVAARYRDRFSQALSQLSQSTQDTHQLLAGYAALFRNTLVECDRLCMCGMLAGEIETIPEPVQAEVARFFHEQQQWLAGVLQQGIDSSQLPAELDSQTWATTFLSSLEGAMLISRGFGEYDHFDTVVQNLLTLIIASNSASHS